MTQQRPHTASSSVPHKNNTSQHGIDKPLLSSRGYGKENDLNTSDNSFKIAHHDDDRFDTNPNTARGYHHNHPKTMITLPPNFGGNYTQYDHDGSRSPITANTTHNNIQLEGNIKKYLIYRKIHFTEECQISGLSHLCPLLIRGHTIWAMRVLNMRVLKIDPETIQEFQRELF